MDIFVKHNVQRHTLITLSKGELKAYALLTKNAADIRFKLYSYQQKADQHQDKLALKVGEPF